MNVEMTVTDKMIALFRRHSDNFDVEESLEKFETEFRKLICEHQGHEIGPDQCGIPEHDMCYVCDQLASELGYQRSHKPPNGNWIYKRIDK